jgi:hypothetical protein
MRTWGRWSRNSSRCTSRRDRPTVTPACTLPVRAQERSICASFSRSLILRAAARNGGSARRSRGSLLQYARAVSVLAGQCPRCQRPSCCGPRWWPSESPRSLRRDLIHVAARTARHGRGHITLHLPGAWHRLARVDEPVRGCLRPASSCGLTSPDPVIAFQQPRRLPRRTASPYPRKTPGQAAGTASGG